MANRKRDAGREAQAKKGWWKSHRWLLLRRLSQFLILAMFLSGPWLGVWILHGNYSSSLLLDAIPFTDPLITLQSGQRASARDGGINGGSHHYGAVCPAGKRLFCSWVCPMNPVTDLASWLRRRFDLNQSATLPRHIRYVLLVVILVGSALTGTLLWEWINPVSLLGRSTVMGFGSGALLILALFLFDLLVVEHGWCGHLCPLGALYSVVGSKGALTVSAKERNRCNRCMDCFHVCPEPHVLRAPVLDEQSPVQVTSRDCMACGRCVDVCSEDVFTITTRWSSGAKS